MTDRNRVQQGSDKSSRADRLTVPGSPPDPIRPQRRSRWQQVFEECREHPNEWRMVRWLFAESSARQLASDIRNGHLRAPAKARIRGIREDDRFEACVFSNPVGEDGSEVRWSLWVKWTPPNGDDEVGHSPTAPRPRKASKVAPEVKQVTYWQVNSDTDRVERVVALR